MHGDKEQMKNISMGKPPRERGGLLTTLKDIGVESITGEKEQTIMNTFKEEEDNAARGIGLIFG